MRIISLIILCVAVQAQTSGPGESPVVSHLVGTEIDPAEEEYYHLFPGVKGFLSGQFFETETGFQAHILTRRGPRRRDYSPEAFYDLGLSIDLKGPINPEVLKELRGEYAYRDALALFQGIPLRVRTLLLQEGLKGSSGRLGGYQEPYFILKKRLGKSRQIPIHTLTTFIYRDPPLPDLKKDVRLYAASAMTGLALGYLWGKLRGRQTFDELTRNTFWGGVAGLAVSPYPVHLGRTYRAELHTIAVPRTMRDRLKTFIYLNFRLL